MKNYAAIFVLFLFVFGLGAAETNGQTRRKKTRRTNTARTPTIQPAQAEVVATSDDIIRQETGGVTINPTTGKSVKTKRKSNAADATQAQQQAESAALSRQVTDLSNKLDSMEKQQRALLDLEKLSRAEERAEMLRRQLIDSTEKEGELNSKLETLEYQMRPEIIERETATVGSTRPEEVRESRRKLLEKEQARAREQVAQIQTSRVRLEAAIANADALVEKLRARVEADSDANGAAKTPPQNPNTRTQPTPDDSDDESSNPQ